MLSNPVYAPFPNLVSLQGRLANELKISYGLAPAIASAIAQTTESIYKTESDLSSPGTMLYSVVHLSEPSGKPLNNCQRVNVKITTWHFSDDAIRDMKTRKKVVLRRICQEAYDQGCVLTILDCSRILLTDKRTIKLYLAEYKSKGIYLPLRGYIHSSGRGQTHKTEIICFYLDGMNFSEIIQKTYHSQEAIVRYLNFFKKIIICHVKQSMPHDDIARVVNVSLEIVNEYLRIYEMYSQKDNDRLNLILNPAEFDNLLQPLKKKMVLK